jgi:RNase H-like domain found in reverse transcriptase
MVEAGFMVNLNKCKFVTDVITAVGHEVSNGRYKPTLKKLQLLLSTPAPRTLQELQSVAGRINHYKRFVPDFQRHFKPIKQLMGRTSTGVWTQECHDALKAICEVLARRIELAIAIPGQPFYLYLAAGPDGGGAVLCQEAQGVHVPVAMVSKEWSATEVALSHTEALFAITLWAMRKLRVYTEANHTTIFLPDRAFLRLMKDREANTKVRFFIYDLLCYRHSLVAKATNAWDMGAEYVAQHPSQLEVKLPEF